MQLLVHGLAHLLELLAVVLLDRFQPRLDHLAHLGQALVVRRLHHGQLLVEALGKAPQRPCAFLAAKAGVFLGLAAGTQVSRSDVTRGVMKYAKDHKLTDKQAIKPDATLRKLLGLTEKDNLTILNLQKYLKGHYVKAVVPA